MMLHRMYHTTSLDLLVAGLLTSNEQKFYSSQFFMFHDGDDIPETFLKQRVVAT